MIAPKKEEILRKVETRAIIRPYFAQVANYCQSNGIEFKIVSGGLDFCIRHILERSNLDVELICPKIKFAPDGLKLEFPKLQDPASSNFKDDTVRSYQKSEYTVLYVGDGYGDYNALKKANLRFVMRDSDSAKLFHENKLEFTEIVDFEPVLKSLTSG